MPKVIPQEAAEELESDLEFFYQTDSYVYPISYLLSLTFFNRVVQYNANITELQARYYVRDWKDSLTQIMVWKNKLLLISRELSPFPERGPASIVVLIDPDRYAYWYAPTSKQMFIRATLKSVPQWGVENELTFLGMDGRLINEITQVEMLTRIGETFIIPAEEIVSCLRFD